MQGCKTSYVSNAGYLPWIMFCTLLQPKILAETSAVVTLAHLCHSMDVAGGWDYMVEISADNTDKARNGRRTDLGINLLLVPHRRWF